jgi:hypothetical protein
MSAMVDLAFALLLAVGGETGPSGSAGFDLSRDAAADFARRVGDEDADEGPDGAAEKPQQDDEKPPRPQSTAAPSDKVSQGLIDFGWLELYPRVGIAMFSSKYHINASPAIEIEARAPLTFLSPSSNPEGDYFGAFAQLNFVPIKRTIVPTLAKASGLMSSIAVGLDYTVYRDETWLLMPRLGIQYTYYGGVTDLKNGGQVLAGFTAGMGISKSLLLTLTPEIVYAKTGDYILMALLGVAIEF